MLADKMRTDEAQDRMIDRYIKERCAFTPALAFEPETVTPEQVIPWPELKERIPQMVEAELARLRSM